VDVEQHLALVASRLSRPKNAGNQELGDKAVGGSAECCHVLSANSIDDKKEVLEIVDAGEERLLGFFGLGVGPHPRGYIFHAGKGVHTGLGPFVIDPGKIGNADGRHRRLVLIPKPILRAHVLFADIEKGQDPQKSPIKTETMQVVTPERRKPEAAIMQFQAKRSQKSMRWDRETSLVPTIMAMIKKPQAEAAL